MRCDMPKCRKDAVRFYLWEAASARFPIRRCRTHAVLPLHPPFSEVTEENYVVLEVLDS